MSKTVTSVLGSWPQDTPLPQPILTISDTEKLEMTEKSTGIGVERLLVYSCLASFLTAAIVSFSVARHFAVYVDGLTKIGYAPSSIVENGKTIQILIPMYLPQNQVPGGNK